MPVTIIGGSTSNSVAVGTPKVYRVISENSAPNRSVTSVAEVKAVVIKEPLQVSKVTEIKQGPTIYTAGPGTISIARFILEEPLLEHIIVHNRATTFVQTTVRDEEGVRIMSKVVPLDENRIAVYFTSATACTVDCLFGLGPLE